MIVYPRAKDNHRVKPLEEFMMPEQTIVKSEATETVDAIAAKGGETMVRKAMEAVIVLARRRYVLGKAIGDANVPKFMKSIMTLGVTDKGHTVATGDDAVAEALGRNIVNCSKSYAEALHDLSIIGKRHELEDGINCITVVKQELGLITGKVKEPLRAASTKYIDVFNTWDGPSATERML